MAEEAAGSVFSLWALPPEGSPARARLSAIIQELSRTYSSPPFEPHVTVLGGFGAPQGLGEEEVRARCLGLCQSLTPYTLRGVDITGGSSYFQCVYLLMAKTADVMAANWRARRWLGSPARPSEEEKWGSTEPPQDSSYMPHLSLIYGDLSDDLQKEVVAKVQSESRDVLVDMEFPVTSLALYRTDPNDKLMKTWEKIAEYPLTGRVGP